MNVWPFTCCSAALRRRARIGGIWPDWTRELISLAEVRTEERVLRSMVMISWSVAAAEAWRTVCRDVAVEGSRTANWPL